MACLSIFQRKQCGEVSFITAISLKHRFMHITFSLIMAGTEVLCQKLCYFLSSS